MAYGLISVIYRFILSENEHHKIGMKIKLDFYEIKLMITAFEHFCVYFGKYVDYIPLAFILGFYVSQIVNR